MSDVDHDDGFNEEAFKALDTDETQQTTPPAEPPKEDPKPAEEPKNNEPPAPEAPKEDETTPPAADAKKPEEGAPPAQDPAAPPETPPAEEPPKPLTLEDLRSVINDVRTEERTSGQLLQNRTNDVLEKYYPDGLSNVLTDTTGKELRTPQDVVEASNGTMNTEEAAQWLMNEQYKLDKDIEKIRGDAERIAETTLKFEQDSATVLQKYEPLFKVYPQVQQKVWDQYRTLVKADVDKGVILSAPDMQAFYDLVLEPYRMAMELGGQGAATQTTQPPANQPPAPAPPTPSADDRLDENGDAGASPVDDPNDFAQQVKKELAKGL